MEAWSKAAKGRLTLIAHTGALSLKDISVLNRKAVELEYDAFSVIPPTFFKPGNVRELTDYCRAAAESAPELPFYFAQLAPYIYKGNGRELPELWAAQQASADADPHAHMAVLTDLGELRNIHPKNKREVGTRLAELALQYEYDRPLDAEFPFYESHRSNGRDLVVKFRNTSRLRTRNGKAPTHFEIAGADRNFQPASARIEGAEVVLTSPGVAAPKYVRFGWHQTAEPNLCGANGLPAGPFSH